MSEHIEDHSKLYEAARSLRGTGMPLSWDAKEISVILDEIIRLRHIVASGLAVSINQENRELKAEVEALVSAMKDILRVTPMGVEAFDIAALVLGELSCGAMGNGGRS